MIQRTANFVHYLTHRIVVRMCENKYTIAFNFLQTFIKIFNGWCFYNTWTIPMWKIFSQIVNSNNSDTTGPMYRKIINIACQNYWFNEYIKIPFKFFCSKFIFLTLFSWAAFSFEEIFQYYINVTIISQSVSHPSHEIFTNFNMVIERDKFTEH